MDKKFLLIGLLSFVVVFIMFSFGGDDVILDGFLNDSLESSSTSTTFKNPKLVDVSNDFFSSFSYIYPKKDLTSVSANGVFNTVVVNNAGSKILLKNILINDKSTGANICAKNINLNVSEQEFSHIIVKGCFVGEENKKYNLELSFEFTVLFDDRSFDLVDVGSVSGVITRKSGAVSDSDKRDAIIDCEQYVNIDERDVCFFSKAVQRNNSKLCKMIVERNKLECFFKTSFSKSDCLSFTDFVKQDECLKRLVVGLNDSSVCSDFTDVSKSNQCFIDFAKKKDEEGVCENLMGSMPKKYCEAIVSGDVDLCGDLDEEYVDACIYYVAVDAEKFVFCDLISDFKLRIRCRKDSGLDYNPFS